MNGYALEDVSLTVDEGEFVTILGSSGCGKTTLIKTVNRLIEPDSGEILLFGEPVKAQDPVLLRRKIGYVIQQIGLFPHMTVAGNIATIPTVIRRTCVTSVLSTFSPEHRRCSRRRCAGPQRSPGD